MADDYSEFKKADAEAPATSDYSDFKKAEENGGVVDFLEKHRILPKGLASDAKKLAKGGAYAFTKAVRGIGEMLPNPAGIAPPQMPDKPEGIPGMIGEVGADLAMSAGPVGAVGKVVKGAGMLPRAVADIVANAGYEAATNPENRGSAAMTGGAGAAGGHALAATIGKLGRPVKTSPITQMMLDEGISLTPGQAGGWLPKALEGALYNTPFMPGIRRAVGKAQKQGMEEAEDFLTDAGRIAANPKAHGLTDAQAEQWIKGAENVNDVAMSTVPIQALAAIFHIKTGGATFASLSALYGTEVGRKVLLGQTSVQEALRKAPELAPHIAAVSRAAATSSF